MPISCMQAPAPVMVPMQRGVRLRRHSLHALLYAPHQSPHTLTAVRVRRLQHAGMHSSTRMLRWMLGGK